MRLQEDLDFTTLSWVKQELDATLKQARQALEAYVEDPADASLIRFCAGYLHQVQGTLRMVELYGAAMLVEEMERLATALLEEQVRQREDGYSVLMRGMVQLPDYLERLQGGHKDIPIVLLPLLNDLRACRGEKLLTESVLFSPDLAAPLPVSAAGAAAPVPDLELRAQAARLRHGFQVALLRWFRNNRVEQALEGLTRTLDSLLAGTNQEEARRLWWIAGGVVEALRERALEPSTALKSLFGRVDREIKRLVDLGEAGFRIEPPRQLAKSLLYYVAHSTATNPRSAEVKRTYRLDNLLPTEQELSHAKGALGGRNRVLLDTVSVAIKDDLLRVKDALDLHLRKPGAAAADLGAQAEVLDRVADTLGMLGLGVPRRLVQQQRTMLAGVAAGSRPADEAGLLDIASALLFVESSLDENINSLGASADLAQGGPVAVGGDTGLPQAEVRRILDAVMKEAHENLRKAKEDVVAFIEAPWDHAKVARVPGLLEEIAGAMRMLALEAPADLVDSLCRFIEVELLRLKRVPSQEQMDRLADSISSIEYYVDASREQRVGRERILDVTRASLESLGYWPVPADAQATAASELDEIAGEQLEESEHDEDDAFVEPPLTTGSTTPGAAAPDGAMPSLDEFLARLERGGAPPLVDDAVPAKVELTSAVEINTGFDAGAPPVDGFAGPEAPPTQDLGGLRLVETEPRGALDSDADPEYVWVEDESPGPAPEPAAAPAFEAVSADEIDDEIREVFIEEVVEEIDNLRRQLPLWRAAIDDLEPLKPIRRSFHTLKGSGRLVGARALGDFSWKIEGMLNRVLDGSIRQGPAVVDVLEHAIEALPMLLAALRGETAQPVDLVAIVAVADRVSAGEDARVPRTASSPRLRRVQVPRPAAIANSDGLPTTVHLPASELAIPVSGAAVEPAPIEPAAIEPAAIEPAAIESAAIEPAAIEPAAIESAAIESAAIESAAIEPAAIEPAAIESAAIEPAAIEPAAIEPAAIEPAAIEPAAIEPAAIEPAAAAPVWAESAALKPAAEVPIARTGSSGPAMPALDPLLLEILRSEVLGHLEAIDAWLAGARQAPSLASESLLRSVHTLHGAVSMADLPVVSAFVGPLEGYIKRLRASGERVDAAGVAAIGDASEMVADVVALLDRPGAPLPDGAPLVARLCALRDGLPEPPRARGLFGLADDESVESEVDAPADSVPEAGGTAAEEDWLLEAGPAASAEPETVDQAGLEAVEFSDLESLLAAVAAAEPGAAHAAAAAPAPALVAAREPGAVLEEESDHAPVLAAGQTAPAFTDEATAVPEAGTAVESFVAPPPTDGPGVQAAAASEPGQIDLAAASSTFGADNEDVDPEGPLQLPEMDEDLLEIFVEEGNDLLDKADILVARLREAPAEHEAVVDLQRQLHTIKGNARAVGLAGVGDLCHAMESLIETVVGERGVLDRPAIEHLERAIDRLPRMLIRVARRQAVGVPTRMIERFEALTRDELGAGLPTPTDAPHTEIASESLAAPSAPPVAAPPAAPAPPAAAPPPIPAPALAAQRVAMPEPPVDEDTLGRAPQEMIRVRSDLLDSLVNFAGEVSIYRSRLEQQVASFRFNLVELEQTTQRLRDQLRKMEIETEAQILSRYQREAEASGQEFDPLELDRFSTQQQLSRALAESVSDLLALQSALDELTRGSETLLLQQQRVSSELQEGLMRTRMVPFDSVVPLLRRLLRQTADTERKRAGLRIEGAQGEMDRNLLERMKAPFEHMLRNAIAHGIEPPGERVAAGKPEEGTVRIAVSREATEVVIRVSDDGRGMDRDAIRRKAIERGLMRPDAQLSDRDLFAFVTETGFSTAERLTQVAGRGVGMDVVANEIRQLGGSLSIDSQRGAGTEFTIRLPFTLAVTQAILVRLGDQVFAVPMSSVQGVARIARDDFDRRMAQALPSFAYAGEPFAMHELNGLLGMPPQRATDEAQLPLLLARAGDQRAAIRVDGVLGSREIVVKGAGPQVSSVPGIFGATIMGDGSVVMILDLAPLVRRSAALRAEIAIEAELEDALPGLVAPAAPAVPAAPEPRRQSLVMVVDDSITMRKVTSRVLERNDMEVVTAKDGIDAVEKLQDRVPDLVLLDIEMPRMDGYELATYMRNDPRLRGVPIIMITSRTGEKHRQRAFEIGVERYLGKPYQEADLLRNVEETLRSSRAIH
ncbi:MAG: Hpt domain-containing protein [Pseudomonadota bacterium]